MPRLVPAIALLLVGLTAGCGGDDIDDLTDVVPTDASATALWISDVHFDPFYPYLYDKDTTYKYKDSVESMLASLADGPTGWKSHTEWDAVFAADANQDGAWSVRGQDANHKLFQEVLRQAGATVSDPAFVLITGDFLGHDFPADYDSLAPPALRNATAYRRFVVETLGYIAATVRTAFPEAPVFATLGNNDAFCGDYAIRDDDAPSGFLAESAALFEREFLRGLSPADQDSFPATFARGGHYAVTVPGSTDNRLVVLNSVPFMTDEGYPKTWASGLPEYDGCPTEPYVDPAAGIDLLTDEAAGPGKVWVAMHVPPGAACWNESTDWVPSILDRYTSLLTPVSESTIAGGFAAHSHMASFKVIRDGSTPASFVLQAPSISPNHGNNASFGVLSYDPDDLGIAGYRIHHLDLDEPEPTWADFVYAGLEGPVTATALDSLHRSFSTDPQAWSTFVLDYGVRADTVVTDTSNVWLGELPVERSECLVISM